MYLWKNDVNDDCFTTGEGITKKISEFQVGIKSTISLMPVRCSYHWATGTPGKLGQLNLVKFLNMVHWRVVGGNQIPMLRHVDFQEGRNRSAQRKPSKSGWDLLKLSSHTTFCSRGGRRDWCPLCQPDFPRSTAQGNNYPDGHPSRYQPHPTGLNFSERMGTGVSLWW